jgi:hypothetical protein
MVARLTAALLGAVLAAAACTAGAGPGGTGTPAGVTRPSPVPGASPWPPTPAPVGSQATPIPSLPPANLSRLNVSRTGWRTDFSRAAVDLADFIGGGPGKDGIPAIDEPKFETLADARTWQSARAPVIALEVNGEARGYPLSILIWHEIVNDTIGGVPVVVTFCPLCNTALVFDRRVGGSALDFGTTGNLRFSDLVMYDRQSESWWQQATGEAIVGSMTGARLTFVPAQIVSLADFGATYPDAPLLSRDTGYGRSYGHNPYGGYDMVDQQPFLFRGELDGRLAPMERVVTIGEGDQATAFPYSELGKVGVAQATVDGRPLVVLWQSGTASALDAAAIDDGRDVGATGVFRAEFDGRRLTFTRAGPDQPIRDNETGSTWSITGRATNGPLAGSMLQPVVHGDHFWFAWAVFAPDTTIWTAP